MCACVLSCMRARLRGYYLEKPEGRCPANLVDNAVLGGVIQLIRSVHPHVDQHEKVRTDVTERHKHRKDPGPVARRQDHLHIHLRWQYSGFGAPDRARRECDL